MSNIFNISKPWSGKCYWCRVMIKKGEKWYNHNGSAVCKNCRGCIESKKARNKGYLVE